MCDEFCPAEHARSKISQAKLLSKCIYSTAASGVESKIKKGTERQKYALFSTYCAVRGVPVVMTNTHS